MTIQSSSAGRDRAVRAADIQADGHEGIVAREWAMQAQLIPELAETRIDVEEDSSRGTAEDFLIPEITHDIQQEGRVSHPLEEP